MHLFNKYSLNTYLWGSMGLGWEVCKDDSLKGQGLLGDLAEGLDFSKQIQAPPVFYWNLYV